MSRRDLGICALCRESRDLRRSHIVPEFLHRPIYDEQHSVLVMRAGAERARTLRKGLRERLLCGACEHRLQRLEDQFAREWYQNPALRTFLPADGLTLQVSYPQFKLFLLSIIWRASISTLEDFTDVALGPHEEVIRRMLLETDPGTGRDYRVFVGLIRDDNTGLRWDNVLLVPLRIRFEGLWAYRLVFGGASWTIVVSRHKPLPYDRFALAEDGSLPLTCCSWERFAREAGAVEILCQFSREAD